MTEYDPDLSHELASAATSRDEAEIPAALQAFDSEETPAVAGQTVDAENVYELSTRIDPEKRAEMNRLHQEFAETRDPAIRHKLIDLHMGLAANLARRYDKRGEPLADLLQVAALALIGAVDRFDPTRGAEFTSFAVPSILGELKRHFRDKTWSLKVPREIKEIYTRTGSAINDLQLSLGRLPSQRELAKELDVSEEDLSQALIAGGAYRPASYNRSLSSSDSETFETYMIDESTPLTEETITKHALAWYLIGRLDQRSRGIIMMRYFENMTQTEIAEKIGISQVHVSRELQAALQRMYRQDESDARDIS